MAHRTDGSYTAVSRASSLVSDDQGMMSIVHIVVVLLMTLLILTVHHIATIVDSRVTHQDAADAIAASAATWQARSLNSLTAVNHVIGEVTALIILHDAMGGTHPGSTKKDTGEEDTGLENAWLVVSGLGAPAPAYQTVAQSVMSSATIETAQRQLKGELTNIYVQLAEAMLSSDSLAVAAVSSAELQVLKEYELTIQLEEAAAATLKSRMHLERVVLPECKTYTDRIVRDGKRAIRETASAIGTAYGVDGFVSGELLPVAPDPLAKAQDLSHLPEAWYTSASQPSQTICPEGVLRVEITRRQIVKVTQLTRATFPWVNYKRAPIVDKLRDMFRLVDVGGIYLEQTTGRTIDLCDRFQLKDDIWLWVLQRSPIVDKGHERWTTDPVVADRLFAIVAVARARGDGPQSVLGAENERVRATYAQAIVYNANPQHPHTERIDLTCKRIIPIRQAANGWDTLNWNLPHGKGPFELIGKGSLLDPHEQPVIRVNWQSKLVPGSAGQLHELVNDEQLPRDLRAHFGLVAPSVRSPLLTH